MLLVELVVAKQFLPCIKTVRRHIAELAAHERNLDIATRLDEAFKQGGGMSCDGLKLKHTGRKVYDLTLHYFQETGLKIESTTNGALRRRTLQMVTRTLFVMPLNSAEG